MLACRVACSQLRLGVKIGQTVHTARHLTARSKLRARKQCDFFHQFGHKTLCVPRATWWRCDSCEYRPRYTWAGTLRTLHNRHHAALGTQSTNPNHLFKLFFILEFIFFLMSRRFIVHIMFWSSLADTLSLTKNSFCYLFPEIVLYPL